MIELSSEFQGKRILVVEDEYFIADDLALELEGHGAVVVGPVPSLNAALELIETRQVDAAILDIELDAETAYPVADALDRREIPFVFVSGTDPNKVPEPYCKYMLGHSATMQAIGQGLFGLRVH